MRPGLCLYHKSQRQCFRSIHCPCSPTFSCKISFCARHRKLIFHFQQFIRPHFAFSFSMQELLIYTMKNTQNSMIRSPLPPLANSNSNLNSKSLHCMRYAALKRWTIIIEKMTWIKITTSLYLN